MPIESPDDRRSMTPVQVCEPLHIPRTTLAIRRYDGSVKTACVKVGRAVRHLCSAVERHITANIRGHETR